MGWLNLRFVPKADVNSLIFVGVPPLGPANKPFTSRQDSIPTSLHQLATYKMSLQSFPRFLESPKELQIQIWHFAFEAADSQAWVGNLRNYTDEAKVAHLRIFYKAKLADCGVLVLSTPYSFKHLYSNRTLASDLRPFRGLMNVCRFFRLMGLEYWHAQVKGWTPGPPSFVKQLSKVY